VPEPVNELRVGIWCAYGETLSPSAGIGVFVHNLARGMAALDDQINVILAVHAGDESLVAETVAAGQGRITTAAVGRLSLVNHWRQRWHRSCYRRISNQIAAGEESAQQVARCIWHEERIKQILASQPLTLPPSVSVPDVWLLPHVDVSRPFCEPTVTIVHDMVPFHFPGIMKQKKLAAFRRHCQRLIETSTLIGTMSRTIRDNDIVGLLGCPTKKVRVVPGAVPTDFGVPLAADKLLERFPVLRQPYLLYPAGYRSYKNHSVLVEALSRLRQAASPDLELVLTGFEGMPSLLEQQIAAAGVTGRVHVLGVVDRPTLAGLYQQAAATVVPSLYEQGSYPVVEAIHWGCPAACSGIAALREYLEPLGGTVPFFDATDPVDVSRTVASVLVDREQFVVRQQVQLQQMASRTWQVVAADWRDVLLEAIEQGRQGSAA
jgi:glycosyltransferase involved in cell wall biosynthesis